LKREEVGAKNLKEERRNRVNMIERINPYSNNSNFVWVFCFRAFEVGQGAFLWIFLFDRPYGAADAARRNTTLFKLLVWQIISSNPIWIHDAGRPVISWI